MTPSKKLAQPSPGPMTMSHTLYVSRTTLLAEGILTLTKHSLIPAPIIGEATKGHGVSLR